MAAPSFAEMTASQLEKADEMVELKIGSNPLMLVDAEKFIEEMRQRADVGSSLSFGARVVVVRDKGARVEGCDEQVASVVGLVPTVDGKWLIEKDGVKLADLLAPDEFYVIGSKNEKLTKMLKNEPKTTASSIPSKACSAPTSPLKGSIPPLYASTPETRVMNVSPARVMHDLDAAFRAG